MEIVYRSIGTLHTPFTEIEGMPIQPAGAVGVRGMVEISHELEEGLRDLDGFSHVVLLYHFHEATTAQLVVTPFLDSQPRGVFATRAPSRPNPIGLSVVELLRIEGNVLHVQNVDMLDGTPLLDVKPYVPAFEVESGVRLGWLQKAKGRIQSRKSDRRFG